MKALIVLLMVIPSLICDRVVLLDLSPEEAQKYISGKSLQLKYARLLAERSLTQGTYDGIYHKGKLIEAPENFLEQVYEVNQFHGQDGLGRAMFGYSDWNQGRLEARNVNGEVRGSYQYVDPYGENILVNYWSDSLGFHQQDNRQRILPEPVTETPEVQEARAIHERAWKAAARAAKEHPDPMSDIYNRNALQFDEAQARRDHSQEIISGVANQGQSLTRYPNLPYDSHIQPEGAGSEDSIVIEAKSARGNSGKSSEVEAEEEKGEPRGFFYDFNYPANLIIENEGRALKSTERSGKSLKVEEEAAKDGDDQNDKDDDDKKKEEPIVKARISSEEEPIAVNAAVEEVKKDEAVPKEIEPETIKEAVKVEAEVVADTNTDRKAKSEEKNEIAVEVKVESTPEVKVEPTPEVKAEAIAEVKAEPIAEVKAEPTPEIKSESKPEEKIEVKIEAKSEVKPEVVDEKKDEVRAEITPEIKEEVKIEAVPETAVKPEEIKPELKSEIKPDVKAELKETIIPVAIKIEDDSSLSKVDGIHDAQIHPKQLPVS